MSIKTADVVLQAGMTHIFLTFRNGKWENKCVTSENVSFLVEVVAAAGTPVAATTLVPCLFLIIPITTTTI